MALRFVASQPALLPLFVAVGSGVALSIGFAGFYLTSNPDVVLRKKISKEPWNAVAQGQNTKLFTYSPDFWKSRIDIPHPQSAFLGSGTADSSAVAKVKAARKAKISKEDAVAH